MQFAPEATLRTLLRTGITGHTRINDGMTDHARLLHEAGHAGQGLVL